MRCEVHCPKEGGGLVSPAVAFAVACAFAGWLLWQVLVILAVIAVAAVVLAVACVPVLRYARRWCVPAWSAWQPQAGQRQRAVLVTRQTALPVGTSLRAIEAPRRPVPGVILEIAKEEAR